MNSSTCAFWPQLGKIKEKNMNIIDFKSKQEGIHSFLDGYKKMKRRRTNRRRQERTDLMWCCLLLERLPPNLSH